MSLTSKDRVEKYLLTTIDSSFDDQLTEWIGAADKYINKMTDRQIIADSVDADYKYSGNGRVSMMIDDFVSITSVTVDGVDVTSSVYFEPVNKTPLFQLIYDDVFPVGRQNVVVTGKRGYSVTPPDDLIFAATVFVAGIVNYSNNSSGEIKSESIGGYSVTYTTDSQKTNFEQIDAIIKRYRRIR